MVTGYILQRVGIQTNKILQVQRKTNTTKYTEREETKNQDKNKMIVIQKQKGRKEAKEETKTDKTTDGKANHSTPGTS